MSTIRNNAFAALAGVCFTFFLSQASTADVVTFGSGSNSFSLSFQAVLNPGNAADTNGFGSVGYRYGISQYEISEKMIDVYNSYQTNSSSLITYANPGRGSDKPATEISWNEAIRFVNWLNTDQGKPQAYNIRRVGGGITAWQTGTNYDPSNPFRSAQTTFALATVNEWYKAAFYDPSLGSAGGYWNYAVKRNEAPTAVAAGTGAGEAVYGLGASGSPASITTAGGLSPWGVMGMNGNAWEWTESPVGNDYLSASAGRYFVGGGWADMSDSVFSKDRITSVSFGATSAPLQSGFRIISLQHYNGSSGDGGLAPLSSVPEPGMSILGGAISLITLYRRWFLSSSHSV